MEKETISHQDFARARAALEKANIATENLVMLQNGKIVRESEVPKGTVILDRP